MISTPKNQIDYFVDIGMGVTFILAAITGIIKWPRFIIWLGLNYSQLPMTAITLIHDWSGILMALLVLVHLVLHWKWIIAMTKSLFRNKP